MFVLSLFMGGCTPDFDPASYLSGLRVLAVRAEPPEASPGQTGTMEALVFDTQGRTVSLDWALCTLAPSPSDVVNPDCVTQESADFLVPLGSGNSITATMPDEKITLSDVLNGLQTGSTPLGYPDTTLGLYVPIRLRASAGSDLVTAVYRWRYHVPGSPAAPNRDPELVALDVVNPPDGGAPEVVDGGTIGDMSFFVDMSEQRMSDGGGSLPIALCMTDDASTATNADAGAALFGGDAILPVHKGETITFRGRFSGDSAELYPTLMVDSTNAGMPRACLEREILRVSWFATAGTFNSNVSGDGEDEPWVADVHLPAVGSVIELFAVGRDDRGGMDFVHRELVLVP